MPCNLCFKHSKQTHASWWVMVVKLLHTHTHTHGCFSHTHTHGCFTHTHTHTAVSHTHTHTFSYTQKNTRTPTHTHTHEKTHAHTRSPTHTLTYIHTRMHAHAQTHMNACMQRYTLANICVHHALFRPLSHFPLRVRSCSSLCCTSLSELSVCRMTYS